MMRKDKVFVIQSASGVVVGGSDICDDHLREEAERIGGTILDGNGNIIHDFTEGYQPMRPIVDVFTKLPIETTSAAVKAQAARDGKLMPAINPL